MSDLQACLSRQPRQVPQYKTEDLSQYLSKPATKSEAAEVLEEVNLESVEVSEEVKVLESVKPNHTNVFTPCKQVGNSVDSISWRQWVMKTNTLSKEFKLLIFESWIREL